MGTKTLVQLVGVLLACALIFGVVKCYSKNVGVSTVEAAGDKQKMFEDFQINSVSEIKIVNKGNTLTVNKGEKNWQIVERDNYPANTKRVVDLLRAVWGTNIAQSVPLQENQYGRVKLGDPNIAETPEDESATIVAFTDGEKDLGTLWLGKPYETASGRDQMTGGPAMAETGRYVKRGNSEVVYVVTETFRGVDTRIAAWLDETFFQITKIKTIERKTAKPEDNWKLTREKIADEFTLEGAQEGEELGSTNVAPMKTAFGNAQFADILVGEAAKVPEGHQFLINTFDGFNYEISLGEKDDNSELPMAFKVSAEIPEARTAVEGESEEDKKKADEAFGKDIAAKKAKLDKEKFYENRVYKIKDFVINKITKSRSELFKEEGADAAPAGQQGFSFPGGGMPPGGFQGSQPK